MAKFLVKNQKWIQKAVKKKGSLRAYVKKRYGTTGFTEKGTIKRSILNELSSSPRTPLKIKQKVNFALRMRELE